MYKARYSINIHKATTIPVIIALMHYYDNFNIGPYVYLALHGTYCMLWLLKECYFPDKSFDRPLHPALFAALYLLLGPLGYWIAPFLLIRSGVQPTPPLVGLAVCLHLMGTFFHFCGDCQKYYTLKFHKGLIQEGLFSHSRNINYLGEILIYLSFNVLAQHWLPFFCQAAFVAFVFYPNMRAKDQSLSRYKGFDLYKNKTWLLLPKIL
eukprot:gene11896-13129_t